MKNCERTYQLYLISKIACGEPMTINSVLRCVVMCCLTGGGNNFMKPDNQQVYNIWHIVVGYRDGGELSGWPVQAGLSPWKRATVCAGTCASGLR